VTRMKTTVRLLGIGWYVSFCILGGLVGGLWLDTKLGLSPLLTLIGLIVGITVAVIGMIRMLSAVLSSNSK